MILQGDNRDVLRAVKDGTVGASNIICGDALKILPELPDNSVGLILTDPPYFRVKGEAWDRQWDNPAAYLEWLGRVLKELHRILKANGSLYMFASPKMAARVECKVGELFNVLNSITWNKPPYSTKAEMFDKSTMRAFFQASERIIFAEHYFEPLRAYLDGERKRGGIGKAECNEACGFSLSAGGMASRHYFSQSQWQLPTAEHYAKLQELFNRNNGGGYLTRKYEDLRRPFSVTAEVPYTDVWEFPTVQYYPGKHPCEKPVELLSHIIKASSRPGDVILDPFMGSGSTGVACAKEGVKFIGIDADPEYVKIAQARIAHHAEGRLF